MRIMITVPERLHEHYKAAAAADKLTVSQWIRECCAANLDVDPATLPAVRKPGRPSVKDAERN